MPRKSNGSSAGGGPGKQENGSALPSWLEDIAIVNWEAACHFEAWEQLHKEIWLTDERLWGDPGIPEVLLSLWKDFRDLVRQRSKVLEDIQWSEVDSRTLVALYAWNIYMRDGAFILQTESRNDETAKKRQKSALNERNPFKTWEYWLFFETLLRKGFKDYLSTRRREDGLCQAITNFVWGYVGPSVEDEIKRRAEKHQGFEAFKLLWAAEFGDDEIALEALDELKKYISNVQVKDTKSRGSVLVALKNREFNIVSSKDLEPDKQYKVSREPLRRAWEHVEGEVFKVTKEGWGKFDLYEALRLALDGMLNIVPTRVANRITDLMRYHSVREKYLSSLDHPDPDERHKILLRRQLEPSAEGEKDQRDEVWRVVPPKKRDEGETTEESRDRLLLIKGRSAEKAEFNDLIERLSGGDPRKKKLLDQLAQGRMKKQIAEDIGVCADTVTDWLEEIKERLHQLTES